MTSDERDALLPATTTSPRDVPTPLYVGLAIGLLGFFVSLSSMSSQSINGEMTMCSYQDYGAMIAGVLCLVCAGMGIQRRRKSPYKFPVAHWIVYALAAVLVVLAVVHVLRGLGMIGGPC